MEETDSAREAASSCHPWSSGVDAAQAITMSAVTGGALAGTTTFTARPLHCDESSVWSMEEKVWIMCG